MGVVSSPVFCYHYHCVVPVGDICKSKWSYVLEVPAVDLIMPCGVVVFALFY